MRKYRVLASCEGIEPGFRYGGPVRSLARTIDTISDQIDLRVVSRDRDLGCSNPYPGLSGRWVDRGHSRIFYLDTRRVGQWLRLWRELSTIEFDLLYVNSLWNPVFTVVPIVAVRLRIIRARRVLISPNGELDPGALSLKNKKKRVSLRLWGPFLKSMDVTWHASSSYEAPNIRAAVPWARIELNSDKASLPFEPLPAAVRTNGRPRLVFISRISPKKNLYLILRALRHLSKPVMFDIYGPLEDPGYWSRCRSLIGQMPSFVQVRYRGELAPHDVPRTFSEYDAFIFPTLSESFGFVIAESLSASCPVICSDQTPWTRVLENGGGAVIRDLTDSGVGAELERISAMTPGERFQARQDAGSAYRSWRKTAVGPSILEQVRLSNEQGPQ
jgi:glycosyltransferase involved in cell wall biosynthesis